MTSARSRPSAKSHDRSRVSAFFGFCLVAIACSSNGGDDSKSYSGAIAEIQQTISAPAADWASKAGDLLSTQVRASGKIDDKAIERELQPDTARLSSKICTEVEAQRKALDLDSADQSAQTDIARIVEESLMLEIARRPDLLTIVGLTTWGTFPPFTLKDPPPAPDTPVQGNPEALATYVKPEFIDKNTGGLALPPAGNPNHTAFQQWYSPMDNSLYDQASFTAGPVRDDLLSCMQDLTGRD